MANVKVWNYVLYSSLETSQPGQKRDDSNTKKTLEPKKERENTTTNERDLVQMKPSNRVTLDLSTITNWNTKHFSCKVMISKSSIEMRRPILRAWQLL